MLATITSSLSSVARRATTTLCTATVSVIAPLACTSLSGTFSTLAGCSLSHHTPYPPLAHCGAFRLRIRLSGRVLLRLVGLLSAVIGLVVTALLPIVRLRMSLDAPTDNPLHNPTAPTRSPLLRGGRTSGFRGARLLTTALWLVGDIIGPRWLIWIFLSRGTQRIRCDGCDIIGLTLAASRRRTAI